MNFQGEDPVVRNPHDLADGRGVRGSRFIMNLSPAELASPEHTCFQIEQA